MQPSFWKEPTAPLLSNKSPQAKDSVKADYYLYSPFTHEKEAVRQSTRDLGTANRERLKEVMRKQRGKRLV